MRLEDQILNHLSALVIEPQRDYQVAQLQVFMSDGTFIWLEHDQNKLVLSFLSGNAIEIDAPSFGATRRLVAQATANILFSCFLPAVVGGTARPFDLSTVTRNA